MSAGWHSGCRTLDTELEIWENGEISEMEIDTSDESRRILQRRWTSLSDEIQNFSGMISARIELYWEFWVMLLLTTSWVTANFLMEVMVKEFLIFWIFSENSQSTD